MHTIHINIQNFYIETGTFVNDIVEVTHYHFEFFKSCQKHRISIKVVERFGRMGPGVTFGFVNTSFAIDILGSLKTIDNATHALMALQSKIRIV